MAITLDVASLKDPDLIGEVLRRVAFPGQELLLAVLRGARARDPAFAADAAAAIPLFVERRLHNGRTYAFQVPLSQPIGTPGNCTEPSDMGPRGALRINGLNVALRTWRAS